jgi:crossover junction endodeoxyribonuclease RuvC
LRSKECYTHVIGLDLSLTEPGWALYNVDSKEFTYGVIDVAKFKGMFRIQEILDGVSDLFDNIKSYEDVLLVLEGYSFGSKGAAIINLGELGGVIRHWLWQNTVTYVEVPPTTAKKFLTGSGASGKSIIIKELYKNFGIDTNNDNIADAINLAIIGRQYLGHLDKKVTKEQQKIVDAIFKEKESWMNN